MRIICSPDNTRAELLLHRNAEGGTALTLAGISGLIRSSGLRGLDGNKVKADIMRFWNSGETRGTILLKEGRAPERGPERALEFQLPFLEDEEKQTVLDRLQNNPELTRGMSSLKAFPLSVVSGMARVQSGQLIASLAPPQKGKNGLDIYGKAIPGLPGNDPVILTHEGVEWKGKDLVAQNDGLLETGRTEEGTTHLRIRLHKDAPILINVSEDKLKAFVSIRPPEGSGAPADEESVRAAAERAGVVKGLLKDAVAEAVNQSLNGAIVTRRLIAEGRLPMKDQTRLSLAVSGNPAQSPVPVKAGDIIGTLLSEKNEGGWNVCGEPLMSDENALKEGDNIKREKDENLTTLIAEKGGHLIMEDGHLFIRHVQEYMGDVSMTGGNIKFPGLIRIEGSVLSRVVIDGGEGVEVGQVVQAALVNSGGDITIGKGIKGEGKAIIRAGGHLSLGYAEEANLLTTGNIRVSKALMNCRIKCNGTLEITSRDGRIIGGNMKLKDGLVCRDVGNERGIETFISFGQDYLVENQLEHIQKELKTIEAFILKTDKLMKDLSSQPGAGNKLIMIRRKKLDALKIQEKKNMRLFLLREKFEKHFESEVRVSGTAWPGVVFESHGRMLRVDSPLKSVRIFFDKKTGKLKQMPI